MSSYRTLWIEAVPEMKERKRVLGKGTVNQPDKSEVDGALLAKNIEAACNEAEAGGYEVVSIMPVDCGKAAGYAGYSVTDGVIITARKKKAG